MTLPRLMISSVLQLFQSICKYSFMVNFDFFLLEPIVRFIYSCLFCFLWLGLAGRGLLSFVWALWLCVAMGNMDGEMDSEGNACVQTLPDTNSMSLLLNYGIICPSVPYYQGLKGVGEGDGVLILPSCIPYYFYHFLSAPHPPPPFPHGFGGWVDI